MALRFACFAAIAALFGTLAHATGPCPPTRPPSPLEGTGLLPVGQALSGAVTAENAATARLIEECRAQSPADRARQFKEEFNALLEALDSEVNAQTSYFASTELQKQISEIRESLKPKFDVAFMARLMASAGWAFFPEAGARAFQAIQLVVADAVNAFDGIERELQDPQRDEVLDGQRWPHLLQGVNEKFRGRIDRMRSVFSGAQAQNALECAFVLPAEAKRLARKCKAFKKTVGTLRCEDVAALGPDARGRRRRAFAADYARAVTKAVTIDDPRGLRGRIPGGWEREALLDTSSTNRLLMTEGSENLVSFASQAVLCDLASRPGFDPARVMFQETGLPLRLRIRLPAPNAGVTYDIIYEPGGPVDIKRVGRAASGSSLQAFDRMVRDATLRQYSEISSFPISRLIRHCPR